jgi:hypothetical protein
MTGNTKKQVFNSRFSFAPLVREWEKVIQEGRPGTQQVYRRLLDKIKDYPELLSPIEDDSVFARHREFVEEMMTSVFPVILSESADLFAVCFPFQYKTIYASNLFEKIFLHEGSNMIRMPDAQTEKNLEQEKIISAYQMILAKLYHINPISIFTSVHPYKSPDSSLDKYLELELDASYVDIKWEGELPTIPVTREHDCCSIEQIFEKTNLKEKLPLDLFTFEGMVILRVRDVTEREVVNKIKNSLLSIHSFSDVEVLKDLQTEMQNLLGTSDVHTGLKPFFRVNNQVVITDIYTSMNKMILQDVSPRDKKAIHERIIRHFTENQELLVISDINEAAVSKYPFLTILLNAGWKSAILTPLFNGDLLIGVMAVISKTPNKLQRELVRKIEPVVPLFKLGLEKTQEILDNQVDRIIKEKFTAVQEAVEWRFTEAALNYFTKKSEGIDSGIEPIVFPEVYPLYGAVDIRNSSVERNRSIQKDLLEQLHMADEIVRQAQKVNPLPLLDQIRFKLDEYADSIGETLHSEAEQNIQNFLNKDILELLNHLQAVSPQLKDSVDEYLKAIDTPVGMINQNRREYEESITIINDEVAKFIDREQLAAQRIFPHYFERFVTDGLDFNIYIGQSINPNLKFDGFYLKNLKLWKLTTLAKAAILTHKLQSRLPIPMETTQLILAHTNPISISFRISERKFDVDGAYNTRYEIVKKRIDKVHLHNSEERLTQPGFLAIVYSQTQEAAEYIEYIEFLQSKQLLKKEIEKHELEELQGISGLKGLRVAINLDYQEPKERQLSGVPLQASTE